MLGAVSLTGCSTKVTIDNGDATGATSIHIETDATKNTASQSKKETTVSNQNTAEEETTTSKQDTASKESPEVNIKQEQNDILVQEPAIAPTTDWSNSLDADKEWNFALPEEEELAYSFNLKTDENTYQEYATIICQGDRGTYWEYETGKFEVGQCSSVELISSTASCIYINEGGTITAINLTDGKVLWRNSDYQGSGTVSELDEDGNLYLAGYFSPALLILDPNGNTVIKVDEFADYFWPYEMNIENNQLTIKYDCNDNAKVTMDITDHSYTIG